MAKQTTKSNKRFAATTAKTSKAKKTSTKASTSNEIAEIVKQLSASLEAGLEEFQQEANFLTNLTPMERRRLIGVRVRNYGFIDKAFDIARDNPQFMPANFDVDKLYQELRDLEVYRQFMLVLQQWLQLATDLFMIQANSCYLDALRIYRSLQEQSRSRVAGARPLFDALQIFFRHRQRPGQEPTEKELERDIKRLLHGTADGEIVIKNETPQMIGGKREVIDNVRKGKTVIKETEQAGIIEGKVTRKK